MAQGGDIHLFCARCGAVLKGGAGDFYVVRIEAFADPAPPELIEELESGPNISEQIDSLIEQMRDTTEQEMMDQVFRRLVIHLCGRCYRKWIENPTE